MLFNAPKWSYQNIRGLKKQNLNIAKQKEIKLYRAKDTDSFGVWLLLIAS